MAGVTLTEAQEQLNAALAANKAILEGGTMYRRGDRWVECPPLTQVEQSIRFWQGEVTRLEGGNTTRGPRIYGASI